MRRFWKDESGQDLVEYALVVGILSLGTVAAMTSAGGKVSDMWNTLVNLLGNANNNMTPKA